MSIRIGEVLDLERVYSGTCTDPQNIDTVFECLLDMSGLSDLNSNR